jgi:hypothetical protein
LERGTKEIQLRSLKMGLFSDLFSTKPAEEAAAAKRAGLQQGYDTLAASYGSGREALSTDLGLGREALTSAYGKGRDALTSGYADASALYKPLIASSTAGANVYADATGVNGQPGIDRSGAIFKALPGYSGGLTTGIDAVNRGAAARGDLGGGNTSADTIRFASDYDAGKYGNFLSSIAPYLAQQSGAIAGGAGVNMSLGSNLSNSFANEGAGLNANYGVLGSGLNASYQGQGGAANANYTGQGQATAEEKLAPYSASQNFWSALTGLGNMALKATGVGGYAPSARAA